MMKLLRLFNILRVAIRYGLDEILISRLAMPYATRFLNGLFFWRDISAPRGVRLRRALEDLGPVFVKFGQVLSTRRDVMAPDIADELAKLQDRVPPFDPDISIAQITKFLGKHPTALFAHFERTPVASASIAQVHFATLKKRHRGRSQGAATRHEAMDRQGHGAALRRCRMGRENLEGQQTAPAAGSCRRIR